MFYYPWTVETCRNNHQFYPCYPHLDISMGLVHCQLRSCFKHISTKPLEDVNTLDCAWTLIETKRFDFPSTRDLRFRGPRNSVFRFHSIPNLIPIRICAWRPLPRQPWCYQSSRVRRVPRCCPLSLVERVHVSWGTAGCSPCSKMGHG